MVVYFYFMSNLSYHEAKRYIHGAGLRATAPRVAVLRLLAQTNRPISHTEVVEAMVDQDWDQATIYRNLLKLVHANLARIVNKIGGITRYEIIKNRDNNHLHPHFACRVCGDVQCLPKIKTKIFGKIEQAWWSSLAASELQLIGDCPNCISG
jgi:Fur family ferric uptake transcriptional regulator